jgi:hypothetical protein
MSDFSGSLKDTVVITDIHAQSDVLQSVVETYGDVDYILAGDSIGRGPDTARTLDIARDIGAKLLRGNWEHLLLAGTVYHDIEARERVQKLAKYFELDELRRYAKSYEFNPLQRQPELIRSLTKAMLERGHLDMLVKAAMYHETDDFIAIHAGLTNQNWIKQKRKLDFAKASFDGSMQLFDDSRFTLSNREKAFAATDKTVITGHSHDINGPRITAGGKRVRLASKLDAHQPLYVWQSWDQDVREIPV